MSAILYEVLDVCIGVTDHGGNLGPLRVGIPSIVGVVRVVPTATTPSTR